MQKYKNDIDFSFLKFHQDLNADYKLSFYDKYCAKRV